MMKSMVFNFLLLVFLFLISLSFNNCGNYLFFEKKTNTPSDIAYIFMGSIKDRTLAAIDYYKSNRKAQVLYGETLDSDRFFFDSIGVTSCRDTDKVRASLIKMGVDVSQIIQLKSSNKSTKDEANQLREYLKNHPEIKKVTLITSSYHSRRAYLIVKDRISELDHSVEIDVYPSPYTNINLKEWWRSKEDAADVFSEYAKLLSFLIWEQFT